MLTGKARISSPRMGHWGTYFISLTFTRLYFKLPLYLKLNSTLMCCWNLIFHWNEDWMNKSVFIHKVQALKYFSICLTTHFGSMFEFYISLKRQKACGFFTVSGVIEMEYWVKMLKNTIWEFMQLFEIMPIIHYQNWMMR